MDPIIVLEGADLRTLIQGIAAFASDDSPTIYRMRFAIDGGLKVKVNEGMWTAPLGEVEPRRR